MILLSILRVMVGKLAVLLWRLRVCLQAYKLSAWMLTFILLLSKKML